MNVSNLLIRRARLSPDAPALCRGLEVASSYAEFARSALALAYWMRSRLQLQRGDRVALLMSNCVEYLEVMYAAWAAGLVVVPINAKLHANEALHILADSGAALLVSDDEHAGPLQAGIRGLTGLRHVLLRDSAEYRQLRSGEAAAGVGDARPDDIAWLFYTSGTTGRPKGVMQTHRNLLAMTLTYFADVDQAQAEDAIVYAAPISHGAGMYNFANVLAGARHVVPDSGGFDPEEMFRLAAHWGNMTGFAAPTMIRRLVEHAERTDASSRGFKTLIYGGGPMYVAVQRALQAMGPRFVQIYGQGECPMAITALPRSDIADTTHPQWAQRLASVGFAQSSVQVRVVDEAMRDLPFGATGEIVVRGEPVMAGYWGNPEATRETLQDGWLRTGDIGVLDDQGYLTLKDRSKDVIISGGSNIYPREVEEVLLQHAAVSEVSVVGRPDAEWGEEVMAVVVLKEGARADHAQLDAHCLASIARFKRPKQYLFVSSLPKNSYGKVLKRELRDLVLSKH